MTVRPVLMEDKADRGQRRVATPSESSQGLEVIERGILAQLLVLVLAPPTLTNYPTDTN